MTMLSAHNISLHIDGNAILQDIELELRPGELLGVIGPNGAGKSTLLRILCGLQHGSSGSIMLGDTSLASIPPRQRAQKMAYLAQEGVVHWPLTVERLVELGRHPHLEGWQRCGEEDRRVVEKSMREADILELRERTFDTLSGGERTRVLLARALAVEPTILLADEPVAALDPAHQLDLMALLRNHCEQGGAAIIVLHDLSLAAHFCHRLQLLHHGKSVANGSPEVVLSAENLERVYKIRAPQGFSSSSTPIPVPWERAFP
jgi:iron complex transport system ATP-binding protein